MDTHKAGDWFILLSESDIVRHVLAAADIGATRYYRAPSVNHPLSDVVSKKHTVGTPALRPYSPVSPSAVFSGDDLTLTQVRRTRRGGFYGGDNGLTDGIGGLLSEESETYDRVILDRDGAALNTYQTTGPDFVYTAAQQTADAGVLPPVVRHKVAQTSTLGGASPWSSVSTVARPTGSAAADAIMATDPAALFRLNETTGAVAADTAGNVTGNYVNTPLLNQPGPTAQDKAVYFDGSLSQTIVIPGTQPEVNASQFTIDGMFNLPALTAMELVSKAGATSAYVWGITVGSVLTAKQWSSSGSVWKTAASQPLTAGVWTYFCVEYSPDVLRVYINNVLEAEVLGFANGWPTVGYTNMVIGGRADGAGVGYLTGSLSMFSYHDRFLTAQERLNRYTALTA